jgi:sugar lactone lactonase YvrE
VIVVHPKDRSAGRGATVTLTASATGSTPLAYQWYEGNKGDVSRPVSDATRASFTAPLLTATTPFWVRVSNALGSADSDTARVEVGSPPAASTYLFVGSSGSHTVKRFNAATGQFIDNFAHGGGLEFPQGVKFGPDGNLYVSSLGTGQVLRFDGVTGEYMDVFATGNGLSKPAGLAFGPDKNLYVSDAAGAIRKFDGTTGAFIISFPAAGVGNGIAFGPDGNLYAVLAGANQVIRLDRTTGASLGIFAAGRFPLGVTFGSDGNLYVTQNLNPSRSDILRFDGATAAPMGAFTSGGNLIAPFDLAFGPDGHLYVGSAATDDVQWFDGTTGPFLGVFADGGGVNDGVHYLTFGPPTATPTIVAQPASTTAMAGDSVNLCVAASGPEPIFYQWYLGSKGDTSKPVDGAILRCYEAKNLTVTVSYWVRVSNSAGMADSDTATITVQRRNHPPVAGPNTLLCSSGRPTKISVAELLADDWDPDSDSLIVTEVRSASPFGTVALQDGWVTYVSAAGFDGEDSFTYVVDDQHGGQAQGLVQVRVRLPPDELSGNMLPPVVQPGGVVLLRFAGIPGRTYRVQRASRLNNPDWEVIGGATIDGAGFGMFWDANPPPWDRFYRTVFP